MCIPFVFFSCERKDVLTLKMATLVCYCGNLCSIFVVQSLLTIFNIIKFIFDSVTNAMNIAVDLSKLIVKIFLQRIKV